MCVRRRLETLVYGLALCGAALPVAAASPLGAIDITHQLTGIWVPATAYGLALIAAVGRGEK